MREEGGEGLPKLNLKLGSGSYLSSSPAKSSADSDGPSPRDDLFTFNYESQSQVSSSGAVSKPASSPSKDKPLSLIDEWERQKPVVAGQPEIADDGEGEAAVSSNVLSLKERLKSLKASKQTDFVQASTPEATEMPFVEGTALSISTASVQHEHSAKKNEYDILIDRIDHLLTRSLPVDNDDPAITAVTDSLTVIHSSVTEKSATNSSRAVVTSIGDNVSDFIKKLTM